MKTAYCKSCITFGEWWMEVYLKKRKIWIWYGRNTSKHKRRILGSHKMRWGICWDLDIIHLWYWVSIHICNTQLTHPLTHAGQWLVDNGLQNLETSHYIIISVTVCKYLQLSAWPWQMRKLFYWMVHMWWKKHSYNYRWIHTFI